MVSELGNKDFLYRLKNILGNRKKHPWGDAVGLKATRVNAIFNGRMPQVDALERIVRAEHVSLDWLLWGTGNPFRYRASGIHNDPESAQLLIKLLETKSTNPWAIHLVELKQGPMACLVLLRPETVKYEDATARFVDMEVIPVVGPAVLQALEGHPVQRSIVDMEVFNEIARGRVGAAALFPEDGKAMLTPQAIRPAVVAELKARMEASRHLTNDEEDLLGMYRCLTSDQQSALQVLVDGIVHTGDATGEPLIIEIDDPQTDEHSLQSEQKTTRDNVGH